MCWGKMNMDERKQRKQQRSAGCPIEEFHFGERRKEGRKERKLIQAKDRSKYKKTDQNKRQVQFDAAVYEQQGLHRGRVVSILSQGILVYEVGQEWLCALRGVLKKEKTLQKNLVAVGDYVWFEPLTGGEGAISAVEPRTTVLSRADNLSRRKEQLIATNIDQVLITVSVVEPPLKPALIDRYVIAARKGNMRPVIVINKVDLLSDFDAHSNLEQAEIYQECLRVYPELDIPVIPISSKTGEGMQALRDVMENRSSVFSGQSGVGKTSLINAVTGLDLRVGDTVLRTRKGAHTTTATSLVPLAFGGWCVDTPGIKSFGVWDLDLNEVQQYFEEIYSLGRQCAFSDCTHHHEQHCAVKEAVEKGELSFMRFMSYQALMLSLSQEHTRR